MPWIELDRDTDVVGAIWPRGRHWVTDDVWLRLLRQHGAKEVP